MSYEDMPYENREEIRPEPCSQCGQPVAILVRTWKAPDGKALAEHTVATECTSGNCFGAV